MHVNLDWSTIRSLAPCLSRRDAHQAVRCRRILGAVSTHGWRVLIARPTTEKLAKADDSFNFQFLDFDSQLRASGVVGVWQVDGKLWHLVQLGSPEFKSVAPGAERARDEVEVDSPNVDISKESGCVEAHQGSVTVFKDSSRLIVELSVPSKIPVLGELWFLPFKADVDFHPVMTREDLAKAGLESLGKNCA
jgi:hypothetical protein